jgi:regulatory protein
LKDGPDSPTELRARALRLLARREHSRVELARKLGPHAESAQAVAGIVDALVRKKQQSDARYAEERARSLARKYGSLRIRQELKSKGIDAALIDGISGAGDLDRARAILARKYREPATTREERAKRMRFLQSRGFAAEIIFRLLSADGED